MRRYNSLQDCESGLSLFADKGNRTLLHGKQCTAGKFWYFDEMMKVYINIKRNSNLLLHQPFNKRIGLMKGARTYRTLHHFSFGKRFDETMMNAYILVISILPYHLINSSDFYPPTSLPDKRTEGNATIRKLVGHPTCPLSDRPTRKGLPIRWYSHCLLYTSDAADDAFRV